MTRSPLLKNVPESFESARLIIRTPRPNDGPELNSAVIETFESLKLWMPWADHLPTLEESETIARQAWLRYLGREDFMFLLFLKENSTKDASNTLVGASGLHVRDWSVPKFEIGYWCRQSFVGQGYISEAVAAITDFGFNTMEAERIEIRCDERNIRSRKVAERADYHLEGRLVNDTLNPQGYLRNTLVFAKTT
jgi:RimJ/RimL family protein N-acetyltransferase